MLWSFLNPFGNSKKEVLNLNKMYVTIKQKKLQETRIATNKQKKNKWRAIFSKLYTFPLTLW